MSSSSMNHPSRIWSSLNLPSLPAAAVRLLELARRPETELADVVTVIQADPSTSAKLLKAANSSYFGFSFRVASVEKAVSLLGTTVVTSLTLSFSLAGAAKQGGPLANLFADLWRQSAATGAAAQTLAELRGESGSDEFLAGLLADLGRLAMLKAIPEDYAPIVRQAEETASELHELEMLRFGFDHTSIGAALMRQWNLPPTLGRAAGLHHSPPEALRAEEAAEDFAMLRTVAVAAAAADYFCRSNKAAALARLRTLTQEFLGFDGKALDDYLNRVRVKFEKVGELLAAGSKGLPDPADLMAQANEQLSLLAVSQQAAAVQAEARQRLAEQQRQELEAQNQRLQQQARHDGLTRLYNRPYFDDAFERELGRSGRAGEAVGLLFCDVDRFKSINDTYGHPFGDEVLRQVAATLAGGVRRCDILARYGGEEFVVLVVQSSDAGLAKVAERLRANVEAAAFLHEGRRVPVTVSIGGAILLPGRNIAGLPERLLGEADAAMYESKHGGRNRVTLRNLLGEAERRLSKLVAGRRFSRWLVNRGVLEIAVVSRVLLKCETPRRPIGQIARARGVMDDTAVERIVSESIPAGTRFGETAIRQNLLCEATLADLLARQQEDPRRLAEALVADGLLDAVRADALLAAHSAELAPALAAG